jgi:hypothetical protein
MMTKKIIFTTALFVVIAIGVIIGVVGYGSDGDSEKATVEDPTADWKTFTNDKLGYKMKYPSGWTAETSDSEAFSSLVFLSSPATISMKEGAESAHVPPDVRVQVINNPENQPITEFALQYSDGWFNIYGTQNIFSVDGHEAIIFSDVGAEVEHAPVLAAFVALSHEQILLLTAPGYEDDLDFDRLDYFEQIIKSLKFN